jgi:hypothetical protein
MIEGIPSLCPFPIKLALASFPLECPYPQADADGRGDAFSAGTARLSLCGRGLG